MNLINIFEYIVPGTKLYCSYVGDYVSFVKIIDNKIICNHNDYNEMTFYYNGALTVNGDCMLFPSKHMKDWNNFNPEVLILIKTSFKKGDIIKHKHNNKFVCLVNDIIDENYYMVNGMKMGKQFINDYFNICYDSIIVKENNVWNLININNKDKFNQIKMSLNPYVPYNEETKYLINTNYNIPDNYKIII